MEKKWNGKGRRAGNEEEVREIKEREREKVVRKSMEGERKERGGREKGETRLRGG